jgi:glycosyltransferase involved in cell wall biosynthesis
VSRVRVVRVAFDEQIFAIQRYGGISRVFAELAHQFIANPELGVELQPVAAPLVNEYILKDPLTAKTLDVRASRHWAPSIARSLARRRHKGSVDVVHNTFYLPRALADYPEAKRVVTVHDMIPELFPDSRRRLDFLTVKKRYVEAADHIICVSESTKRDLQTIFGSLDAPITVVPSGVGPEFTPKVAPLAKWPQEYLLHVGHREGYKGGDVLFKAFSHIMDAHPNLMLMLAGGGPLTVDEKRNIAALHIDDRVLQEQLPDSSMPSAYANAQLFVFPSECEGFGLPILEAMASGTATVLCEASALPEVGGNAAIYFSARDSQKLAQAISALLDDEALRSDMIHRGQMRAREYSWERTARVTADVYREVVVEGSC